MPPAQDDLNRDEITQLLLEQKRLAGSPVASGVAGMAGAMPANMPTQMPTGMPQTPAGGVPGSGLATAAPSVTGALPPQARSGGMPNMGALQQLRGSGQMSNMEAARAGQALPVMQGAGQSTLPVAPGLGALGAMGGGGGGMGIMSMMPQGMRGGFASMLPGMQGGGQISDKEYQDLKDSLSRIEENKTATQSLRGVRRRGY